VLDSSDGIQTTHAGSLPRSRALIDANRARLEGVEAGYGELLTDEVTALVGRERAAGISVPNDGEYGKAMSTDIDYGAWWSYSFSRLGGLELVESGGKDDPFSGAPVVSSPGDVKLTTFPDRRDWTRFAEAYQDPKSGIALGEAAPMFPTCTGPLVYTGQEKVATDIANLKTALAANGYEEGFITSLSPGSASRVANQYYATDEEWIYACADALREEYTAIVESGLILQIDDPSIAENWDQINPEPSVEDYIAFTKLRVEALNHALRGLPQDRIRFHLCWGSWHGPHTTDLEFRHIVSTMLEIDAGAYSFEAANARHEHEWRVWEDVALPDGKLILPGVVGHATNVVEHPELVADRIERFAGLVGRERVLASTDCGLGGRIHPQIATAKLETLSAGAALATKRLWRSAAA
jgi:5-methyltetrahydropteroyltriglutamate--homocysteine methyltransferase